MSCASPTPSSMATRQSTACAATISSMASAFRTLKRIVRIFRAACADIETWSSAFAPVGIESTEAGWASTLFSDTSDAAVYCALGDGTRVRDGIARRPVHLRRATQRVRVLYRRGAFGEAAAAEQLAHARGAANLAGVAARFVHFGVERARTTAHCLERQCGRAVGERGEALGVVYAERQHRGREVDAVDEGQALFERRRDVYAENRRQLLGRCHPERERGTCV